MQKRRFLAGWIVCTLCCLFPLTVFSVPQISAQAAVVIEASGGRILYQKNAETSMEIASTTKIVTALTAIQHGNLADLVTVSASAAATEGSGMYVYEGEKLTLEQLLYGLMLASGNDAAVAIAEHFGTVEEFVAMMNQTARELGAENTHFANPNGLPNAAHRSTALDMAHLTAAAMKNEVFARIVSTQSYRIEAGAYTKGHTLVNHNRLLRMCEGCIGVKTGYTRAAGRCLVSAVRRNDMTLICVTLSAPDDWNDHQVLYDDCFDRYHMTMILHSGTPLDTIEVIGGDTDRLAVTVKEDLFYPLAESENYALSLTLSPPLLPPIEENGICGELCITVQEQEVARMPLVTVGSARRERIWLNQNTPFGRFAEFLRRCFAAWKA